MAKLDISQSLCFLSGLQYTQWNLPGNLRKLRSIFIATRFLYKNVSDDYSGQNDPQNANQNENIVPIKHTCVTHGMVEQENHKLGQSDKEFNVQHEQSHTL